MVSWQSPSSLVIQMEISSLLALDAIDRAIGDLLVHRPVQRHSDRKTARCGISNNLNAANGLAPGPLSNGLQALFSESRVAHSDSFPIFDASNIEAGWAIFPPTRCAHAVFFACRSRRSALQSGDGNESDVRVRLLLARIRQQSWMGARPYFAELGPTERES
jgi:hypothetical protein